MERGFDFENLEVYQKGVDFVKCFRKKRTPYTIHLLVIFLLLPIIAESSETTRHKIEYQRAFTYQIKGGHNDIDRAIEYLSSLNVNYLVLLVKLKEDKNSPLIYRDPGLTPDDSLLKYAIEKANSCGMKVVLSLHIKYGNDWCANINFNKEAYWEKWANYYKDWIRYYAKLGEENKVSGLVIGAELCKATNRENMWREIIKEARGEFSGFLTYSAHPTEYEKIKFWDELDYIGIAPYFSLSSSKTPTIEQLKDKWEFWLSKIEPWQKKINKPVLFTEIGFPSVDGVSMRPWALNPILASKVDYEEQRLCYEATFEACYKRDWLYGIYWWIFELNKNESGFTPFGKPACNVISLWYSKIR